MCQEQSRLEELESYDLFNNRINEELQELTMLASQLCDVPLAQVTIVDENHTWVKAETARFDQDSIPNKVPRKHTFCHHAIQDKEPLLIIKDAINDQRFQENPYVVNEPNLRFYAGVQLVNPNGHALGTLCVLDTEVRELAQKQTETLKILAKKACRYLERHRELKRQRDEIKFSAKKLRKLTNNLPVGIFQMSMPEGGQPKLVFFNKEFFRLFPHLPVKKGFQPEKKDFFQIHEEDMNFVMGKFFKAFHKSTTLNIQYRILIGGEIHHYLFKAKTEKNSEGIMQLYGSIRDVSERVQYEETIEQIASDLSHVVRRPVASLLGLSNLIKDDDEFNRATFKEYANHIKAATEELDVYTKSLNNAYQERRRILHGKGSQI